MRNLLKKAILGFAVLAIVPAVDAEAKGQHKKDCKKIQDKAGRKACKKCLKTCKDNPNKAECKASCVTKNGGTLNHARSHGGHGGHGGQMHDEQMDAGMDTSMEQ